jgi:hypothetical protein
MPLARIAFKMSLCNRTHKINVMREVRYHGIKIHSTKNYFDSLSLQRTIICSLILRIIKNLIPSLSRCNNIINKNPGTSQAFIYYINLLLL